MQQWKSYNRRPHKKKWMLKQKNWNSKTVPASRKIQITIIKRNLRETNNTRIDKNISRIFPTSSPDENNKTIHRCQGQKEEFNLNETGSNWTSTKCETGCFRCRVVMYRILKYSIRIPDTFFDICIYSRYFWIFGYSILFTKYRILLNTWMINTYSGKACDDIFTTYAHTTHEYINTHDTLEHTHTQAHFSCKRLRFLIIFSLSGL